MPVPIRPEIAALTAYKPGGAAPAADALKLSSNENPFEPLDEVVAAAHDALTNAPRYPDTTCGPLRAALAERHQVTPDRLAFGAGSVSVLMHMLQAVCTAGDEVVYPWRSFEAYPLSVSVPGATAVPVPLTSDGHHDLDAMVAAITPSTRVVVVCTPNNPTGPTISGTDLEAFIDRIPQDTLVVIDEAYVEFVTDPDAACGDAFLDDPRVAVLRTFSKAWGLAGLRVGYAITSPELAAATSTVTPPFSVSAPAQAAALAALGAADVVTERVQRVVVERERLVTGLRDLGFAVPASQGNFIWLPAGPQTEAWADHFATHGLVVRAYAPDGIRITVGTEQATERVLSAAADLCS